MGGGNMVNKAGRVDIVRLVVVLVILLGLAPALGSPAAAIEEEMWLSPDKGSPGTQVLATGHFSQYGTGDTLTLWWDAVNTGPQLGSVPLRADGSFALSIRIPPNAASGFHEVIADVDAGYPHLHVGFEVTAVQGRALYVHGSDVGTANEFRTLLDASGLATSLVDVGNLAGVDLAAYDIVMIGHDTGSGSDWYGSEASVQNIEQSGRPVLGLGRGGAALYEQLDLFIRSGNCWTSNDDTQVYAYQPEHPIWNTPYQIPVASGGLVQVYEQGSSARGLHLPSPQPGVVPLGREGDDEDHFAIVQEDARYSLWGFHDGPETMTSQGRNLLINTIYYVLWAMDVNTLILTDFERMDDLGFETADVNALENDINWLRGEPASKSNMTAIHRDLDEDVPAEVAAGCDAWVGNEGDVDATNTCVAAIDAYTESLKQGAYPNLYYLIVVGTTEIIPMKAREQDHLFSAQEKNWGNNLPGPDSYLKQLYSTPGAVNGWGHYLTDSVYGDLSYITDGWGADHELVPELAVGRLVETPAQISDLIDTYLIGNARFSRTNRVSIASNDYLDGGTLASDRMDPGTDDGLVQNSFDSSDVPPKLNAMNDLVYFGGHGNYNQISTGDESFRAGNHASHGDTDDLGDMPDAVIVTSGCHNGASFGNNLYHAPDADTTYSEYPEEFADKRVGVYVGATGYTAITTTGAGTDVSQVRHNEKLSTYMIQHLDQDGTITAGEAFRRAVNSYVADVGSIGTIERRVIAITTLYGIPNYRAPAVYLPWSRPPEYWLEYVWFDPPPYLDPGPFRYQIILEVPEWEVVVPGPKGEWYVRVPGGKLGGNAYQPLLPVFQAGVVLPIDSSCTSVEWNQAASGSEKWTAQASMYVPPAGETPAGELEGEAMPVPPPQLDAVAPMGPGVLISTTTAGGAGVLGGLNIVPLQYNSKTGQATLWTKLVFDVTCQAAASTDADGDGLGGYWESSNGLNPNDATGDDGAGGDPDKDGLPNDKEQRQGTSPVDPDTDGDGVRDGTEVRVGTGPLNPGDTPDMTRVFLPVVKR